MADREIEPVPAYREVSPVRDRLGEEEEVYVVENHSHNGDEAEAINFWEVRSRARDTSETREESIPF